MVYRAISFCILDVRLVASGVVAYMFRLSAFAAWSLSFSVSACSTAKCPDGLYVTEDKRCVPPVELDAGTVSGAGSDHDSGADATIPVKAQLVYGVGLVGLFRAQLEPNDTPVQFTPQLVPGGEVFGFQILPGGGRVVYRAEQDTDRVADLYTIKIDGTGSLKLNPDMGSEADVLSFDVTPDGSKVIYRLRQDNDGESELYATDTDGAKTIKLNSALSAGTNVVAFAIAANGNQVVYATSPNPTGYTELFAVNVDGTAHKKISPFVPAGRNIWSFDVLRDGSQVFFVGDIDTEGVRELYAVNTDGTQSIKLNPDFDSDRDVGSFHIAPNGNFVAYSTRTRLYPYELVDELYIVNNDGSTTRNLVPRVPTNSPGNPTMDITPDGARIVFIDDPDTSDVIELYYVNVAGTRTKLSGDLAPDEDVSGNFALSPDGTKVVYRTRKESSSGLHLKELDGAPSVRLTGPYRDGVSVGAFAIWPDGRRVVYVADEDVDNIFELYVVGDDGSGATKLNSPLPLGAQVSSFALISANQ